MVAVLGMLSSVDVHIAFLAGCVLVMRGTHRHISVHHPDKVHVCTHPQYYHRQVGLVLRRQKRKKGESDENEAESKADVMFSNKSERR